MLFYTNPSIKTRVRWFFVAEGTPFVPRTLYSSSVWQIGDHGWWTTPGEDPDSPHRRTNGQAPANFPALAVCGNDAAWYAAAPPPAPDAPRVPDNWIPPCCVPVDFCAVEAWELSGSPGLLEGWAAPAIPLLLFPSGDCTWGTVYGPGPPLGPTVVSLTGDGTTATLTFTAPGIHGPVSDTFAGPQARILTALGTGGDLLWQSGISPPGGPTTWVRLRRRA